MLRLIDEMGEFLSVPEMSQGELEDFAREILGELDVREGVVPLVEIDATMSGTEEERFFREGRERESVIYTEEDDPDEKWEVWSEGYVATGQRSDAQFMGYGFGATFKEACAELAQRERWGSLYNKERNTHWGCRLFRTEAEARKSFG